MFGLAILVWEVVGFALGLTGGGGGIFAVPLLVYGLSVPPREAVGISLAAVGGTALMGAIPRWRRGEVDLATGALFAACGMLGAPLGNLVVPLLPDRVLLLLFSALMLAVAVSMWRKSRPQPQDRLLPISVSPLPLCQRTADRKLFFTMRCAVLLGMLGLLTGILSGMFGVGGGFVIVPALVLFSGMAIHYAVATSLMVIVLVSLSGVSSYLWSGGHLSWQMTGLFLAGGFIGIRLGNGTVAATLRTAVAADLRGRGHPGRFVHRRPVRGLMLVPRRRLRSVMRREPAGGRVRWSRHPSPWRPVPLPCWTGRATIRFSQQEPNGWKTNW